MTALRRVWLTFLALVVAGVIVTALGCGDDDRSPVDAGSGVTDSGGADAGGSDGGGADAGGGDAGGGCYADDETYICDEASSRCCLACCSSRCSVSSSGETTCG
jgi:hypothetical protein